MSDIEEFCRSHDAGTNRNTDDIIRQWVHEREVDDFLGTPVTAAVLIGDLLCGDGLEDQISPDLLKACSDLMGEKAGSFDAVRQMLLEKLENGDGSVHGWISKIQGQIGENEFLHHVGSHAHLAESGSQEGWDIAIDHADKPTQWVQVKTYSDANGVMKHIREVQEKLSAGLIHDGDQVVDRIDFSVPENIVDEVREKVQAAGIDIDILTIPMTSDEARAVVSESVANVGPEALSHFFGELLAGTLTAAAIHGAVNGFLVYKGAKERSQIIADTVYSTGISSGGLTAAFATEAALHKLATYAAFLGGPTTWAATFGAGMTARMYLKRVADRRNVAERLADGNDQLTRISEMLIGC